VSFVSDSVNSLNSFVSVMSEIIIKTLYISIRLI